MGECTGEEDVNDRVKKKKKRREEREGQGAGKERWWEKGQGVREETRFRIGMEYRVGTD